VKLQTEGLSLNASNSKSRLGAKIHSRHASGGHS